MEPEITRFGVFDMQVCVPAEFADEAVEEFANSANSSGTEMGWRIRHAGDEALARAAERVPCGKRDGCVHVMLDC